MEFRYPKPQPQPTPRQRLEPVERTSTAEQPRVVAISVLEPGVYDETRPETTLDTGCPVMRFRQLRKGKLVRVDPLQSIGFLFVLRGAPETSTKTTTAAVTMVVTHPLLIDPITGRRSRQETRTLLGCLDQPAFAGWRFASDFERVDGVWTIELKWQGYTMATQEFVLSGGVGPLSGRPAPTRERAIAARAEPAPRPTPIQPAPPAPSAPPVLDKKTATARQAPSATQSPAPPDGTWFVQVAACLIEENAQKDVAGFQHKGYQARVLSWTDSRGRLWHIVALGAYASRAAAETGAAAFKHREKRPALVKSTHGL